MIHNILKDYKVILASASPRRRQIFEMLGIKALYLAANIDEPIGTQKPYVQAKMHALNKAKAISKIVDTQSLIIASDTVVATAEGLLGKPSSPSEAITYLGILSGKTHFVYSAICIMQGKRMICDYERSSVTFDTLNESEIVDYVSTKEPMDKAGAYGIQGYGAQFIKSISGCYFNVMGFPINLFYKMLKSFEEAK